MRQTQPWTEVEKRLDLFINHPMPMWIYDYETRAFLEVNEEAIRHYGYSREEFLSMTINDIRPAQDIPKLDNLERFKIQYSSVYTGHWRHYKRDGTLVFVEITSHLIDYGGREACLVMVNDITERIKAEQQQEFQRRDKEALINSTTDMMWSVSRSLKLVAANQSFASNVKTLMGVDILPGDYVLMDSAPESMLQFWKEIYQKALTGCSQQQEVFLELPTEPNGRWIEIRFNPIIDHGEIKGVACYARNITERKQNEAALIASKQRYELLSRATSDMVWAVDLTTGDGQGHKEAHQKLPGQRETDFKNFKTQEEWQGRVHPEDREKLNAIMRELALPGNDFFEFECRVLQDDGRYAHHLDKGYVVRDAQGRMVRLIGATQDMTEKKEAERLLRVFEQQQQLAITEAIIQAQENEREVIGSELHDNITQILATAKLYVGMMKENAIEDDLVSQVDEFLSTALTEIRNLSHALIAPTLGKIGLTQAIGLALQTMCKAAHFTALQDYPGLNEEMIPEKLKLSLYRIVQEQLNNIQKHAHAKTVSVKIEQAGSRLKLIITDDGVGFDPAANTGGIGLKNIRTRAALFGGEVIITTALGQGCRLEVLFEDMGAA